MLRWLKSGMVSFSVLAITLVAAGSIKPACWYWWYQPEVPQELLK